MTEPDSSKKYTEIYKQVGPYLGLGVQLAASIVLMLLLGHWLDGKFNSYPVLTILGGFLGGFAGMYNVIKTVLELNKKQKK